MEEGSSSSIFGLFPGPLSLLAITSRRCFALYSKLWGQFLLKAHCYVRILLAAALFCTMGWSGDFKVFVLFLNLHLFSTPLLVGKYRWKMLFKNLRLKSFIYSSICVFFHMSSICIYSWYVRHTSFRKIPTNGNRNWIKWEFFSDDF